MLKRSSSITVVPLLNSQVMFGGGVAWAEQVRTTMSSTTARKSSGLTVKLGATVCVQRLCVCVCDSKVDTDEHYTCSYG